MIKQLEVTALDKAGCPPLEGWQLCPLPEKLEQKCLHSQACGELRVPALWENKLGQSWFLARSPPEGFRVFGG